jgi:transglutaminase-like putative cysteine protease
MYYTIRHQTTFRYPQPISELVMEVRAQPRTEWTQHCLSFEMHVSPRTRVLSYRDYLGNTVHHFNVPAKTSLLNIITTALVEVQPFREWPERLPASSWDQIDTAVDNGEFLDFLLPSEFAKPSPLLLELAAGLHVTRRDDPMTVLRQISDGIHKTFEYVPNSTRVDSPIDDALRARKGVCQDFAHIMTTLVRQLRIPCRYVSGYVSREDTSERRGGLASHAWVEALLPGWGWVGFDPTKGLLVGDRHVRCAIGRDYADVPPTKGVYKGDARGELSVQVKVIPAEAPSPADAEYTFAVAENWLEEPPVMRVAASGVSRQQQQQQQQ